MNYSEALTLLLLAADAIRSFVFNSLLVALSYCSLVVAFLGSRCPSLLWLLQSFSVFQRLLLVRQKRKEYQIDSRVVLCARNMPKICPSKFLVHLFTLATCMRVLLQSGGANSRKCQPKRPMQWPNLSLTSAVSSCCGSFCSPLDRRTDS